MHRFTNSIDISADEIAWELVYRKPLTMDELNDAVVAAEPALSLSNGSAAKSHIVRRSGDW